MMSYRKNVHTDETFRVATHPTLTNFVLEHRCERNIEGLKHRWIAHMYCTDHRAVPCSWCKMSATPGLQAIFLFMKGA
jgi:hypothetical protein